MANLKEIRTRISSVKSTRQITSAMKLVSAAKLKKAQKRIENLRPYAEQLQHILSFVGNSITEDDNIVYLKERPVKKILIVMIASNKGLCGGFNANVTKKTVKEIENNYNNCEIEIFSIGSKGAEIFKKEKYNIVEKRTEIFDDLTYDNANEISSLLMNWFAEGKYDKIITVYNQFINAATQRVQADQFLPLKLEQDEDEVTDYIFEPDKLSITQDLIPKSLKTEFYRTLLDSNAAEHGARMTAMHQATDNASELIGELNLQYNKARQATITNEILEITSGANALKDS